MYYLVYSSHAKVPFQEKSLEQLLFQCQRNNSNKGVTGLLLYTDQKFVQVIEGDKNIIQNTYKKIQEDPRHEKVEVLIEGHIKERNYAKGNMGYRSLMPEEVIKRLGYRDPAYFFRKNKVTGDSHVAQLFMKLFYDQNFRSLKPTM